MDEQLIDYPLIVRNSVSAPSISKQGTEYRVRSTEWSVLCTVVGNLLKHAVRSTDTYFTVYILGKVDYYSYLNRP